MCKLSSSSSSSSSPGKTMKKQQQQQRQQPHHDAAHHEESIDSLNRSIEDALEAISQTSVTQDVAQAVANLSASELQGRLEPVTRALRSLNARYLLQTTEPIHAHVRPLSSSTSCIRYLGLETPHCHKEVSLGIFVFPPHATIPLHDHPRMCVMSRVLYGRVHVKSFDWLAEDLGTSNSSTSSLSALNLVRAFSSSTWSSWSGSSSPEEGQRFSRDEERSPQRQASTSMKPLWLARREDDCVLTSGQVVTLYPTKGNIHEFTAGPEGAAVLDVLLPPYSDDDEDDEDKKEDHDHRDCTYYRAEFYKSHRGDSLYQLIPTAPPATFDCISGTYPPLQWR